MHISSSARVGKHVVFADDTNVGDNVTIGNNVTFYPGVHIHSDCIVMDGAVLGRPPRRVGTTTRAIHTETQSLIIGSGSIIGVNAVLYMGSTIGTRVMVSDLASIREGCTLADECVVGRGVLIMYDTQIGERTRIIDGAIITGNAVIEADVFIGPGVNSVNDNDVYLKRFGLEPFAVQGPTVRRFALIGTGANLAAGVEIGMGAIVAPSAMVTHHVRDWEIVAGVPARALRMVPPEQRLRILEHFGLPEALAQLS